MVASRKHTRCRTKKTHSVRKIPHKPSRPSRLSSPPIIATVKADRLKKKHTSRCSRQHPSLAFRELTKKGDGMYDPSSYCEKILRQAYPSLRVYSLPSHITRALVQKLNTPISHSVHNKPCTPQVRPGTSDTSSKETPSKDSSKCPTTIVKKDLTHFELFRCFSGYDHTANEPYIVLLKGGCVRDLIQGKAVEDIHDIDITHTMPFGKVRFGQPYGLHAQQVQYYETHTSDFKYIKVGKCEKPDDTEPVDCTETKLPPFSHYEAPVNTLFINVTQTRRKNGKGGAELDRVYDITGKGIEHARQKIWAAPSADQLHDPKWLYNSKLWRMLKFIFRGYKVNNDTRTAVYKYWLDHYDDELLSTSTHVWINPWKKIFGTTNAVVDSEGNTITPQEAVERVLRDVFRVVGADFDRLHGFGAKAAASFILMFINKKLFTTPGQFSVLKATQESRTSKNNHHVPSNSSGADDSTTNRSVYTKCMKQVEQIVSRTTFRSAVAVADDGSTKSAKGKNLLTNARHCEMCTRVECAPRNVCPNMDCIAHKHPDTIRLCKYIRTFSSTKGCTAKHVFERLMHLHDIRLVTTYPFLSWVSYRKVPNDFKNSPSPFDYPQSGVVVLGSSKRTAFSYTLDRTVWEYVCHSLKKLYVKVKPVAKCSADCSVWSWIQTISEDPAHPRVYISGPFIDSLACKGVAEQAVHDLCVYVVLPTSKNMGKVMETTSRHLGDVPIRTHSKMNKDEKHLHTWTNIVIEEDSQSTSVGGSGDGQITPTSGCYMTVQINTLIPKNSGLLLDIHNKSFLDLTCNGSQMVAARKGEHNERYK